MMIFCLWLQLSVMAVNDDIVFVVTVKRDGGVLGVPGEDDALEAALGLGDLAGLTVNNEADPLTYDVSNPLFAADLVPMF